ncbi:transporter involved in lipid transport, partial [mine drainage metagenome]
MLSYIGSNANYAQIEITMSNLAWDPISSAVTTHLDSNLTALENRYSFTYYMGGTSQGLNDVFSYASSTFMLALPILVIAIFIVLFVQLYAVFTPLRLILMVLIAVVVALAATYIVIDYILHYALIIFLPIFVIITLLAVGLDYDIFMITRVREEMLKGATTEAAIIQTIQENGGVIITLGLLLFVTFISLSFTGIPIMYEIGLGLALGVL